MKKHLGIIIMLIIFSLQMNAQRTKDALYLKNGSIIYGVLVEISDNQYKIQTSDGSIFNYQSSEVEKFVKEIPPAIGRKSEGFGLGIEAGVLIGSQNSEYPAPFSFNFMASYTSNTKNIISLGSGVEFIGVSFTPLFLEYRYLMEGKRASPFLFVRGGGLIYLGDENNNQNDYYQYYEKDYKGGLTSTIGLGISWIKEDIEHYLSFAYRYVSIIYDQNNSSYGLETYTRNYNRLEIKFGFRF